MHPAFSPGAALTFRQRVGKVTGGAPKNASCIFAGQEPKCLGGQGWPREAGMSAIHGGQKNRRRAWARRRWESRVGGASPAPARWEGAVLHVVGRFAVRADVEALALLFLGDAQSDDEVRDLECD